jgi:predicted nucleic acid-binding protein
VFLLDTNVVSELRKFGGRTAHANVVAWATKEKMASCYISVITIMEIEIGVQRLERRDPTQGAKLRAWMDQRILVEFSARIIPIDAAIALVCAKLHVPTSAPFKDSLIAATALIHGMTVVTRNVVDFESTGVRILNPWIETDPR